MWVKYLKQVIFIRINKISADYSPQDNSIVKGVKKVELRRSINIFFERVSIVYVI